MLILVGQGNPGDKYAGNRHNIGFMAIDEIASMHGFGPWKSKFQAQIAEGNILVDGRPVKTLLMKPQTFYNETGRAVSEAARFYKVDAENIVVFHDEIDLAPGRFRMKQGGGHSGNNGMRSIISHMGQDVRRARMGVGHPGDKSRVMNYVLADFPKADQEWMKALLDACARAANYLVAGDDERYQTEVLRLAPAPKNDPRKAT
ncbi:aminoacyl-tRNA hydrolase [Ponticaulis sp.]|uniref:aminoacyl-tRNA hydrolase n=1 Tax=Ponticaulis sp. TaxID=2020902 RepID=UPI000B6E45BD|nr:aminoacyl-tRNA hydrolase [Ponticaulis sp.]MAJ09173.1 aminoacyl-tRNA hydrolase [Ponticaulis sp.]RPG16957.1 MAG: aminoacyl-tRNA hydrolase [Hyphomonadaceae bacterium TMED125]HBH88400.1 aminoacyl-tRNA hydrolase [Hyphomonadaceae bacterium]HBJ92461.1 aminoacyl-tRNA hydrolase [Hyphomonadaceae bacterium]